MTTIDPLQINISRAGDQFFRQVLEPALAVKDFSPTGFELSLNRAFLAWLAAPWTSREHSRARLRELLGGGPGPTNGLTPGLSPEQAWSDPQPDKEYVPLVGRSELSVAVRNREDFAPREALEEECEPRYLLFGRGRPEDEARSTSLSWDWRPDEDNNRDGDAEDQKIRVRLVWFSLEDFPRWSDDRILEFIRESPESKGQEEGPGPVLCRFLAGRGATEPGALNSHWPARGRFLRLKIWREFFAATGYQSLLLVVPRLAKKDQTSAIFPEFRDGPVVSPEFLALPWFPAKQTPASPTHLTKNDELPSPAVNTISDFLNGGLLLGPPAGLVPALEKAGEIPGEVAKAGEKSGSIEEESRFPVRYSLLEAWRLAAFAAILEKDLEGGQFQEWIEPVAGGWQPTFYASQRREYLWQIVNSPRPSRGFVLLEIGGILEKTLSELSAGRGLAQNRHHRHDIFYHSIYACDASLGSPAHIRFSALFHDLGKVDTRREGPGGEASFHNHEYVSRKHSNRILSRFQYGDSFRERVGFLVANHMFHYTAEWTDAAIRRFLRKTSAGNLKDMILLRLADRRGSGKKASLPPAIYRLLEHIRRVEEEENKPKVTDLSIGGHDLMRELGMKPGPEMGRLLQTLLNEVLAGRLENNPAALLAAARNSKVAQS